MQAELFQIIKDIWTKINKATKVSTAPADTKHILVKGNRKRPTIKVTPA